MRVKLVHQRKTLLPGPLLTHRYTRILVMAPAVHVSMDPLFRAQAKYRARDFDTCIEICTALLTAQPLDQVSGRCEREAWRESVSSPSVLWGAALPAKHNPPPPPPFQAVWLLKCRALTERAHVDELAWEDEGLAETLLDDHSMASAPRVGTSMHKASESIPRPGTSAGGGGAMAAVFRPMTASGRPMTGFARPGTSAGAGAGLAGALRVGTQVGAGGGAGARAVTAMGRTVRLGTASLLSAGGGVFVDVARLDLARYAKRPALAQALAGYLLYVDGDAMRVLELASAATAASCFADWTWKSLLGRAYARLGLLRDADRQFNSALRLAPWNVTLRLHAGRCALRLDQPSAALRMYEAGVSSTGGDTSLLLAAARVQERMGNAEAAVALWRRALVSDATASEAIACLAAHSFYNDQPEVAIRHYRRLLLASGGGASASAELWTDLGLATFYAGQFDLALPCLERAIVAADGDTELADVWYNVGCVAVGCGDANFAVQAWTIALAAEPKHAEAHTNMGVLEARRGNIDAAKAHYSAAQRSAEWLYEAWYNGALLAWRLGDVATAHTQVARSLIAFPAHAESIELKERVTKALR